MQLHAAAGAHPYAEIAATEEGEAAAAAAGSGSLWADAGGWSDTVERRDGWPFGAGGAQDPFSLDWPAW